MLMQPYGFESLVDWLDFVSWRMEIVSPPGGFSSDYKYVRKSGQASSDTRKGAETPSCEEPWKSIPCNRHVLY